MEPKKGKTILVTGGLGYIGSHTTVELIKAGFDVVIIDNLSNSEKKMLNRIEAITSIKPKFYDADVCDRAALQLVFLLCKPELVIHFAAFKSVAEAARYPVKYFQNNLGALLTLLQVMEEHHIGKLIFSSSATVYGQTGNSPVREDATFQKATTAYGASKQMGEEILEMVASQGRLQNISLRYFNPVGAHSSGLLGELPKGVPNNLFPYVLQTIAGILPQLTVYGADYDTPDGSCVRDYIHVVDLALAHVAACRRLIEKTNRSNFEVFNLGTGTGRSVLEVISRFEQITGQKINYRIGPRREGDLPAIWSDPTKANHILGWHATSDLDTMIQTGLRWQSLFLHS